MRRLPVAACVLALTMVLGACSTTGGKTPGVAQPGPVPTAPSTSDVMPKPKGKQFLKAERPMMDVKSSIVLYKMKDERTMTLGFTSGNDTCFGISGWLEETPTTVTVDVREGVYDNTKSCTMEGKIYQEDVELSAPLGSRKVVDAFGNPLDEGTLFVPSSAPTL